MTRYEETLSHLSPVWMPYTHIVSEKAEGCWVYDISGEKYLDFTCGIGVTNTGHCHPAVVKAIQEQAAKFIHAQMNLVKHKPIIELVDELQTIVPEQIDCFFFTNSGAEAIEGAIKFSRRYARAHFGEGKTTIVAFDGSFHGRTMGAVAITAREKYREPFMPVMPGVRFARYNDLDSLAAVMGDDVCAVVVEPVQGEGGLRAAEPAFMQGVRELCQRYGALLVFDEIQGGVGRTGTLWAHEQLGVQPDIMTVAKPLAGGLPIGAVLMGQHVADTIHPGDHGTTFGGNPLATAVGTVVFRKISDPAFLAHVQQESNYLDEALQDFANEHADQVLELRGRGLMRGVRIAGSASAVREAAHRHGLLVATAGEDVIRLLPPLIIEPQHVDEALSGLRAALRA